MPIDQGQYRYGFPGFRVFIFGIEVTDDILSINTTSHDGNSPNSCQITLTNDLDKYIITTKDMMVLTGHDPSQFHVPWLQPATQTSNQPSNSISPSGTAFTGLTADNPNLQAIINNSIDSQRKRQVLSRKVQILQQLDSPINDIYGQTANNQEKSFTNYFGKAVSVYPLSDGLPIFHSMDPVRVFLRDPFNPGRWYHAFAGFVSDMVDNTDENSTKVLTIEAEDVTKLFRYTRAIINPGVTNANTIVQQQHDLALQSFNQNFFHNYSLEEIFFTLIFGPEQVGATTVVTDSNGPQTSNPMATRLRGIGHFSFDGSAIFAFGPPPTEFSDNEQPITQLGSLKGQIKINSLQDWQMILDHEVQPSDLVTMATDVDRATDPAGVAARVIIKSGSDGLQSVPDIITYIGSHPEQYLIDGGRLLMLLPNSLGVDNNNILTQDIIQAYPMNSQWTAVGSILYEIVDRIQFSMYATPRGDLVVEFPLYDFNPDDFGVTQIGSNYAATPIGSVTSSPGDSTSYAQTQYNLLAFAENLCPGRVRGPFGSKHVILKKDTYNWESAVVDEKVHTFCVSSYALIKNWETIPYSDLVGSLASASLPNLVPLYGVRMAQVTPRGYVGSLKGAGLFANITLNRLNSDAHTINISHAPNIQLWLNRPVYVQGRNCLGTTKQISHNLVWGQAGTMDTTSDLYALRTWQGQYAESDPNKPIYTTIGGYSSEPLNYSLLMRQADLAIPSDIGAPDTVRTSDTNSLINNLSDRSQQLQQDIQNIDNTGNA